MQYVLRFPLHFPRLILQYLNHSIRLSLPDMCTSHFRSFPSFHPLFLLPLSLSNVYSSAKEASGEGGSPHFRQAEEGGDSEFVEIPIGEKERLLSPPRSLNATECENCRKTPSNLYLFAGN